MQFDNSKLINELQRLIFRWILSDFMLLRHLAVPFVHLPPRVKNHEFCKKKLPDELETLGIDSTHALNIS